MTKLNQILAVEKSVKARYNDAITKYYHLAKRTGVFDGLRRTYRPLKDGDLERIPSESKAVQIQAQKLVPQLAQVWSEMLDVIATKDWANQEARADIVVDGNVIVPAVPVSYLLYLEKQLMDLHTVLDALPTYDGTREWVWNADNLVWTTDAVETMRTRREIEYAIMYEATDKHPAQVDKVQKDVTVGIWTTVTLSGALSPAEWQSLKLRVYALQDAVKQAREAANMSEITQIKVGEKIFGFILGQS